MDDDQLIRLAGRQAFERGCRYHADGRVDLSRADAGGCRALVHGTERYRVSFAPTNDGFDGHCDCPAAEDGSFCKHLVATARAWRDEVGDDGGESAAPASTRLQDGLHALPRERVVQWLHEAALDDPDLHRRLELRLAVDDPAALRSALDSALRVRGFLDYRRSLDFARQLDEPIESLRSLGDTDPGKALELTERALKRLLKVLERSDDSAGAVQDQIAHLGDLHARAAARADIETPRFARTLHKLKKLDEWDFLPLAAYWDMLGERGRAAYRACIEKEYAALAPSPPGGRDPRSDGWYDAFPVLHRREELAHCEGDCDALIEVYSRDLGWSGHGYQRIVRTCREHGREAEATRWAEQGVRDHPEWPGLRELLADCYRGAGMAEEALEQVRLAFRARPNESTWSALSEYAGDAWPGIREEALAMVAENEHRGPDGKPRDTTLRARLLEADGDADAAVDLALSQPVHPGTLESLANRVSVHRPGDAAELLKRVTEFELQPTDARGYPKIVRRIAQIRSLADSDATRTWIDEIRQRYKARRKLMQLMDEMGL